MFMDLESAKRGMIGTTDRSYRVVAARLAAGAYPNPAGHDNKLAQLLDGGINLTQDYPGGADEHMNRYDIPATDRHAIVVRRRITDNGAPPEAEMVVTLDVIDRHLRHGCNVYIHRWRGSGRTGKVVGCRRRRHGYAGADETIGLPGTLRRRGDRKGATKQLPRHPSNIEW